MAKLAEQAERYDGKHTHETAHRCDTKYMCFSLSRISSLEMVSFTKDVAKVIIFLILILWKEMEGQRDLFEYPNLNFKCTYFFFLYLDGC